AEKGPQSEEYYVAIDRAKRMRKGELPGLPYIPSKKEEVLSF
ncbi:hypothetical protein NPIL_610031, partial [Nephila pilipes]